MGRVVLTTGVFDCGMHIGHFILLLKCQQLAGVNGRVIVGVNSDESAESYKRKPVMDRIERMFCVSQIPFVETAFVNSEQDIIDIIKKYRVDIYVKGSEWRGKKVTGEDLCHIHFFDSIIGPDRSKISTTEIILRARRYSCPVTPNKETVLEAAKKDSLI